MIPTGNVKMALQRSQTLMGSLKKEAERKEKHSKLGEQSGQNHGVEESRVYMRDKEGIHVGRWRPRGMCSDSWCGERVWENDGWKESLNSRAQTGRRKAEKGKTLHRKQGRCYPGWAGHRDKMGKQVPNKGWGGAERVHFGSQAPWQFLQLASEMEQGASPYLPLSG